MGNRYQDMDKTELFNEQQSLLREKTELQRNWMVDDPDGEWDQVLSDLDSVNQVIAQRQSEKQSATH